MAVEVVVLEPCDGEYSPLRRSQLISGIGVKKVFLAPRTPAKAKREEGCRDEKGPERLDDFPRGSERKFPGLPREGTPVVRGKVGWVASNMFE